MNLFTYPGSEPRREEGTVKNCTGARAQMYHPSIVHTMQAPLLSKAGRSPLTLSEVSRHSEGLCTHDLMSMYSVLVAFLSRKKVNY